MATNGQQPLSLPSNAPTASAARTGHSDFMPERPDFTELILRYYTDHICAIGKRELRISDSDGYWHTLPLKPGSLAAAVLMDIATSAAIRWYEQHDPEFESTAPEVKLKPQQLPAVAHELYALLGDTPRRTHYSIPTLAELEFNNPDYIPLDNGAVFSISAGGQHYGPDAIRSLYLTQRSDPGMTFDTDLLATTPPLVDELIDHYQGLAIFNRIAYTFAYAPSRRIDTIISPLTNSGKNALTLWLRQAAGAEVSSQPLSDFLKAGAIRFTTLERLLCNHRLVFANEADKPESVNAAFITRITEEFLPDERKGIDSVERPRRGDLMFIGNDSPRVELAPGVNDSRMRWAYRANWPEMPPHLYQAIKYDPAVSKWLSTYLLNTAAQIRAGKVFDWSQGYIDASEMHANAEPEETAALRDAGLVPGSSADFVTTDSIRAALDNAGLHCNPRTNLKFVAPINARAQHDRKRLSEGRSFGFYGLRWDTADST